MVIIPLCLGYMPSKAGFKLLPHNNLENYMKLKKKKKNTGKTDENGNFKKPTLENS